MEEVDWTKVDDSDIVRKLFADTEIVASLEAILGKPVDLSDFLGGVKLSFITDSRYFQVTVCAHCLSSCFWEMPPPSKSWDELDFTIKAVQPEWHLYVWDKEYQNEYQAEFPQPTQGILCTSPNAGVELIIKYYQEKLRPD